MPGAIAGKPAGGPPAARPSRHLVTNRTLQIRRVRAGPDCPDPGTRSTTPCNQTICGVGHEVRPVSTEQLFGGLGWADRVRADPAGAVRWYVKPFLPPIRAVLFDFDGTLVDSEYLHHESWLEAVAPWGVTLSWDDYERQLVGISDLRACEFFLRMAGMEVTPDQVVQGRSRKHLVYRRRSIEELSVHPDVADWIRDNRKRVPMGVVSSSAIPDVVPILRRQRVANCMQFVICGDHVERLKPDPEPYSLALEKFRAQLGRLDSHDCLVFEDSSTGIQAGIAAGMTVHALESPRDLPIALETWQGRIRGVAAYESAAVRSALAGSSGGTKL